jgi:hypothetical protein
MPKAFHPHFVDVPDVELPASAQAAIYTVVGDYLDWLHLYSPELWRLIQIDMINFHERCKGLPAYETLAMMTQTAPFYDRYLAEQSREARAAVICG